MKARPKTAHPRLLALMTAAAVLAAPVAPAAAATRARPPCGATAADSSRPYWARQRHITVLVDSVLLSGKEKLRGVMSCRRIGLRGRPAMMLRIAEQELRAAKRRVAPLVVVGLGHNSLWSRNRERYGYWAARFDGEATRLVETLRRLGARQIVWVTLREPQARYVPPAGRRELGLYAWYFPYVNERLRVLDRERDDVVLADWAAVSDRPGLTYDSIHLTAKGGVLMARTIRAAIDAEAERQARARQG